MAKPIRLFKIDVQGQLSYDEKLKTIGLEVMNFGYVKSLSRNFNTMLSLHGFKVREESEVEEKESVQLVLYNGGITKGSQPAPECTTKECRYPISGGPV